MSNAGAKLVSAGGLRAPLAELIERFAVFGFPPASDPGYAAAIDRECEKLIRKFEDAPDMERWALVPKFSPRELHNLNHLLKTEWHSDCEFCVAYRTKMIEVGIFVGQDVTGQGDGA